MEDGMSNETMFEYTKIDPWFLAQLRELHETETWVKTQKLEQLSEEDMWQVKKRGYSDLQVAKFTGGVARQSDTACWQPC